MSNDEIPKYSPKNYYRSLINKIFSVDPKFDLFHFLFHFLTARLHRQADGVLDAFHKEKREAERRLRLYERGNISARFYVQKSGTIRVVWLYQNPLPQHVVKRCGKTVISRAFKFKGDSCPRSTVLKKGTKKYEEELFDKYEPKFKELRRASLRLGLLMRSSTAFINAFARLDKVIDEL